MRSKSSAGVVGAESESIDGEDAASLSVADNGIARPLIKLVKVPTRPLEAPSVSSYPPALLVEMLVVVKRGSAAVGCKEKASDVLVVGWNPKSHKASAQTRSELVESVIVVTVIVSWNAAYG